MYLIFCSLQVRPEPNLACIAEQVWWSSRALEYKRNVFLRVFLRVLFQRSSTSSETHVTSAWNSPNFLKLFCIDIPDIADFLHLDTFHLQNKAGTAIAETQQTKIFPGLLRDMPRDEKGHSRIAPESLLMLSPCRAVICEECMLSFTTCKRSLSCPVQ